MQTKGKLKHKSGQVDVAFKHARSKVCQTALTIALPHASVTAVLNMRTQVSNLHVASPADALSLCVMKQLQRAIL